MVMKIKINLKVMPFLRESLGLNRSTQSCLAWMALFTSKYATSDLKQIGNLGLIVYF